VNYRRFKIKTVEGQDDFASMAEVVKRRYSRLLREGDTKVGQASSLSQSSLKKEKNKLEDRQDACPTLPDLILIDGGKGQLNAACGELKKLGLEKIPVIGLAKEFEEIYVPGNSKPLRLGLNHPAVKLLQRIRDECHRVANSYNAQLRIKRISESVLDEFPGIGERRKQALLKKFGSVQRLRTATLEQIAAIPGFGGKAAAELKTFLEARSNLMS
jgi:excinuclease ABC subunit C